MKLAYSFLTIAVVSLFIISCQREVEDDLPPGPPTGTQNDSIYLSSYVELDTTYPSGTDTVAKFLYQYDAQKRVVFALHMYPWDGTTTSGTVDSLFTYYFYHGSDTLPYKAVYDIDARTDNSEDTSYFTYSNGLVLRDSAIRHNHGFPIPSTETVTYTPSGNNTIVHGRKITGSIVDQWTGTILQARINGNIVMQSDTSTYYDSYTGNTEHMTATYDNKPDPFYRIGPNYPISFGSSSQRNNYLTSTVRNYGQDNHYRTEYVYRADGYPLLSRSYHQEYPSYVGKGYYYYTK